MSLQGSISSGTTWKGLGWCSGRLRDREQGESHPSGCLLRRMETWLRSWPAILSELGVFSTKGPLRKQSWTKISWCVGHQVAAPWAGLYPPSWSQWRSFFSWLESPSSIRSAESTPVSPSRTILGAHHSQKPLLFLSQATYAPITCKIRPTAP